MIPVNEPLISEKERKYVLDCLESGWISSGGPYVERFEQLWAEYCGADYGVSVSSGTAALFAAVAALDLSEGDEVIMPTFTIISCAHAVLATGAVPILVDSDPTTWCMNVDQIESLITPRTKAIMAVHIYGHPVDFDVVTALSRKLGLAVVEDAAEAHGATYKGRRVGNLGHISCFSFYANKIVTTGEGGMVVTDDEELAHFVRNYRNLAFRNDRRFFHTEVGHNFRLTNLQAAFGVGQLENIDERVNRKREIGHRYTERLKGLEALQLPAQESWAQNVYWMYGIVLQDDCHYDAESFARALREAGVDTRPFFIGMHEQPVFLQKGLFMKDSHPVSERIARRGLYLPSGLALSDDQIDIVAEAVTNALSR